MPSPDSTAHASTLVPPLPQPGPWPAATPDTGQVPTPSGGTGVAVLSRFVVANDKTAAVKAAFQARPHLVDRAPGFLRMDVLSPQDRPEELWLLTYWTDETSYRAWHRSHEYHASHRDIPKGLKVVPTETELRLFTHVAS